MVWLAIIPSIVLFIMIWRKDKIEKEPVGLLIKLFIFGALTTVSAGVIGMGAQYLLLNFLDEKSMVFIVIDNFLLTALVEEGGKYFVLKKATWKHPAFNYTFDAVVYAVCSSLGFATLENILYLIDGDLGTAVGRGLLSVPGHVIFAVFMGYYYGMAKYASVGGDDRGCRSNLRKALWVPVLLHGMYDFCLSTGYDAFLVVFIVFVVVMSVLAIRKVRNMSKNDNMIS